MKRHDRISRIELKMILKEHHGKGKRILFLINCKNANYTVMTKESRLIEFGCEGDIVREIMKSLMVNDTTKEFN